MRKICILFLLSSVMALVGCASVPKEVVELSYVMGSDLNEVQRSYEMLIRFHFDDLRRRTDDFLVSRWQPTYLHHFIQDGDLVGLASEPNPNEVLTGVQAWAEVAIEQIQTKRRELLHPLDLQEAELLAAVGAAFERLHTANATISAHLNSIRNVDELQSDALTKLGLGDLRKQLDEGLAQANRITEEGIQRTIEADHLIDQAQELRDRIGR